MNKINCNFFVWMSNFDWLIDWKYVGNHSCLPKCKIWKKKNLLFLRMSDKQWHLAFDELNSSDAKNMRLIWRGMAWSDFFTILTFLFGMMRNGKKVDIGKFDCLVSIEWQYRYVYSKYFTTILRFLFLSQFDILCWLFIK